MPRVQTINPDYQTFASRTGDSFPFAKEISKPHGILDDILDWAKSELLSEWRWQLVDVSTDIRPGRYIFYFDSARDYCAFILKWA